MTGFDYTSTARRPRYEALPTAVHASIAATLGGGPDDVRPAGGGFTPGFAAAVRRGDRSVFVKAAPGSEPFAFPAYTREADILRVMPADLPVPRLLSSETLTSDVDGVPWILLVIEHIDGVMPGDPWTPDQADSIHAGLVALAAGLEALPQGTAQEGSFTDGLLDAALLAVFAHVSEEKPSIPFLPGLTRRAAKDLGHLLATAPLLLEGSGVVHNDLRPDNIIIQNGSGRAYVCDWNFLARGPAWSDWVALLPYLRHDGLAVEQLLASSPLVRDADPEAIDAWLAVLAAYMVRSGLSPEIPHSPALRHHARFTSRIVIDWLSERRKWAA